MGVRSNRSSFPRRLQEQAAARGIGGLAGLARQELSLRAEGRLLAMRMRHAARSGRPVLVGPFLGEVGFEILYWIPLVRGLLSSHGIPANRVVALARGGSGRWYSDVAGRYVDAFDLMSPDDLQRGLAERRERAGDQKQVAKAALDRELARHAISLAPGALQLHPRVMHLMLRDVWAGRRPVSEMSSMVRYAAAPAQRQPAHGVALKIYENVAFANTVATRAWIDAFAAALSQRMAVTTVATAAQIDGHRDIVPVGPGVRPVLVEARESIGRQTELLSTATVAVTTYGGMAYVPMLHGVPTLALRSADGDNPVHLEAAQVASREIGATLRVLDVRRTSPQAAADIATEMSGKA